VDVSHAAFLYAYPGFVAEEIEPRYENGETWRLLKVTFPDHIASHTRQQTTYFGPVGLLRRHDYAVDILGGSVGAQYIAAYREFDGIMMPTRRLVFSRGRARPGQPACPGAGARSNTHRRHHVRSLSGYGVVICR
jgi:hypothetical protein